MKLSVAIQDYLIEAEVRKYSPKTIKGKKTNLGLYLHFYQEVVGRDQYEWLAKQKSCPK